MARATERNIRDRLESYQTDTEDAAIEAVDTPGKGETLQRRREALREMYDYLKEQGTARRRDRGEDLGA